MTTSPRSEPYFASSEECNNCPYQIPCVSLNPSRSSELRISRTTAIDCIYRGLVPDGSIQDILANLQEQVRRAADARFGTGSRDRLTGGLNNSRGEWFENILGLSFWNIVAQLSEGRTAIVKLPNNNQMNFYEIFEERARGYLQDLFDSLSASDINMQMSNPDFLCVTNLSDNVANYFNRTMTMSTDTVSTINNAYQHILGECNAESIPFVISVKTSLRPDRRYQLVHEANVVKTLMAHLSGRFWNQDLNMSFYAIVSGRVSAADRQALRNPATYSLVHVSWKPVVLVDRVFGMNEINDVNDISQTVKELLL